MKSYQFVISALIVFLMIPLTSKAQLLDRINRRAHRTAERVAAKKLEHKAEQELEKALDSALKIEEDQEQRGSTQSSQFMMQNREDFPMRDVYEFNTKVSYLMETNSNGETTKLNYGMWFSKDKDYMATELANPNSGNNSNSTDQNISMISVLDDENQLMIMLMEEQKMGQVMSMDQVKNVVEEENIADNTNTEFNSIKKTGRQKEILGYNCEEYSSENEGTRISLWVTNEIDLFQKNMFFNINKSLGGNTFKDIPAGAKGFMMEMNYLNTSTDEKSHMIVVDIEKTTKSIQTDDYQYMNLSMFMPK